MVSARPFLRHHLLLLLLGYCSSHTSPSFRHVIQRVSYSRSYLGFAIPTCQHPRHCTMPPSDLTTHDRILLGLSIAIYFLRFLMNDVPTTSTALTSPVMAAMYTTDPTYCDDTQISTTTNCDNDTHVRYHRDQPKRLVLCYWIPRYTVQQTFGLIFAYARFPSETPNHIPFRSAGCPNSDLATDIDQCPGGNTFLPLTLPPLYIESHGTVMMHLDAMRQALSPQHPTT